MQWHRPAVLLLLSSVVLCASVASPQQSSPTVTPAQNATYPNTSEGLQTLLNDLLSATKSGDSKTVDGLIEQTEFPDYGKWFLRTYSPDPEAASDWDHAYKNNVTRNEGLFRELLAALAKDDSSKILVRKVNDNPQPHNGLERGMLQYARTPIDVYCATLSSSSHNELNGYFVYVDGMFRWDNLSDFAKPDTYSSDPSRPQPQEPPAPVKYLNTTDGLRSFLSDLRAAAKSGQEAQVTSMIKQTEIPDYRSWYSSMYIPGSALSWAKPYGRNLDQNELAFQSQWEKLAKDDGEFLIRKLVDKPGDSRGMEWGMIHNSRAPLDIYNASWKSAKGAPDEQIGYFIYIDGMFRWQSPPRIVRIVRINRAPQN